jgi:hypothetical protein
VIGVSDVLSDFTTLALIPTQNPFFLFHVSLASLLCSVAASLLLSFYSSINLSWPARAFIFITGTTEYWHRRRFWGGLARKMEFKIIIVS